MEEREIFLGNPLSDERSTDQSLRPRFLHDFIGQTELKTKLTIFLQAAKQRGDALDHTLFSGPPGLGKTSLANVIAREMGVQCVSTSGPALEKAGDLAAILTNLNHRDVLFIDEIHRLNRTIEEALYPALEDFTLDLVVGQGPSARVMKLPLQPFTLVGATTRAGLLTSPLMGRFGITLRLPYYSAEDLQMVILRAAGILRCKIDFDAAFEISRRARGTPRIANRLLRRVRDVAEIRANGHIDLKVAKEALGLLDIDEVGLDHMDRQLLRVILENFSGGPVGVDTLAATLSEESETIEDVYEPYLIQMGFLSRTSRGRMATEFAARHLKLKSNAKSQEIGTLELPV